MRHIGGQMQQSNAAAATSLYENTGPRVSGGGDASDAVVTRWLRSAGLQHLASPMSSNAFDPRLLPNLLMQGYGPQSAEEKQRLVKLMRNLNFNLDTGSEPYTPTGQSSATFSASDGFFSPDIRGDFGAGLLDLHSMDDTELLSDHVISEPFEPSAFMPSLANTVESDFHLTVPGLWEQTDTDVPTGLLANEKERENNVAKIKVVVRKRPLNKKEIARKEDDVVTVDDAYLTVHEPKLKVDLTAYVEKHEFCFDAVLDEHVTNDEVYRVTVEPIIPTIFQRTKATCFAYGQTGSGKTYTMQPLPLRAAEDLIRLLHQPIYRNQRFKLWLSFFEIYGGKLFDLLGDRKKLCMREDGRQQVCIVGLQEFEVSDVQIVKDYIERGNAGRSTGSTGANEESSRSHAILQLAVKKHSEVKESKRNNDGNDQKSGKIVGKISFIDLAGSERGADTTDNDRQTRIEGAEINKSLLALKECIRALDNDQIHIPFRGSKLTEVLRDSFVGNSRTVMISCISPNAGSCEHTLNTLRYADRVKSLSKGGNVKKDQTISLPPSIKESSTAPLLPVSADAEDFYDQHQESKAVNTSRRVIEKENPSYSISTDDDKQHSNVSSSFTYNGHKESHPTIEKENPSYSISTDDGKQHSSVSSSFTYNGHKESHPTALLLDREELDVVNAFRISISQKTCSQNATGIEENMQKTSQPVQKVHRDGRTEKPGNEARKDSDSSDTSNTSYKQQNTPRRYQQPAHDGSINEILEEEAALISAHRKEIEDTMEIVSEEMKLLAEVDQPGSHIDNYITQLNFMLSRKAASLVSLQARLERFQHRLKEQEILSRKRLPR